MGFKLMQGLKIQDADIIIIPHFVAYKGLKGTYSIRNRLNQAEDSEYEILIQFE